MEHLVSAEKGDMVVSEITLWRLENEFASSIIVFGDSRNLSPSFLLTILASLLIIFTCYRKIPFKWWDRIPPSGSLHWKRKRGLLPSQYPSPRPDGRTLIHSALTLSFMCLNPKPRGGGRDTTSSLIKSKGQILWSWPGQQSHNTVGMMRGHSPTYKRILGPKQRHPPSHEWYFREHNMWKTWTFLC